MSATAINICGMKSGICSTLAALGASDTQLEAVGYGTINDTDLLNLLTGNVSEVDTASGLTIFNPSSSVSATAPAPPVAVQSSATDLALGSLVVGGSGSGSLASNIASNFSSVITQIENGLGIAGPWIIGIVTVALFLFLLFEFR